MNQRSSPYPRAHPVIPPKNARMMLSLNACTISLRRVAPNAERTARSWRRLCERASKRLATFAHTIIMIASTAPNSSHEAVLKSSIWRSRTERILSFTSFLNCGGTNCMKSLNSGCSWASAWAMVTPRFSRAKAAKTAPCVLVRWAASSRACGTSTCAAASVGNSKLWGNTPMMVVEVPSSGICCPRIFGSAPKRPCHNP